MNTSPSSVIDFYSAPAARLSDDGRGNAGWRDLGFLVQSAVLINAAQLLFLAFLATTLSLSPDGATPVAWVAVLGIAAALSIPGLWLCRQLAWLRALTFLANLIWLLGTALLSISSFGGPDRASALSVFGVFLTLFVLPPASTLAAQIVAFRNRG
jgi:hypothetical protein